MRKALVLAAIHVALFLPAVPALAARFDIRLEERGPDRTLIVTEESAGAVAVAAGRETLRLLPKTEALAVYERLKAGGSLLLAETAPANAPPDRRIVIHRLDVEEDLENGVSERERGVVRKHVNAASPGAYDSEIAESELLAASVDDAPLLVKRTELEGADEKTAAAFIDAVSGLASADKARLKSLVGIAPSVAQAPKGFAVIRAAAEKPTPAE
jgi:hypothetical protein